jgi:hypothetical protein
MEVLEVVVQVLEQEEALAAARHLRHITQVLQLRPVALEVLEVEGLVMWQAEKDLGVEVVEVMECPVQNTRPQPHEP